MSTVIFYHYPCADGIFGALAPALVLATPSPGAAVPPPTFVPLTVFEKENARTERALRLLSADTLVYLIRLQRAQDSFRALCGVAKKLLR